VLILRGIISDLKVYKLKEWKSFLKINSSKMMLAIENQD